MKTRIKVVVIGAGSAGMCAGRHLLKDPDSFEFDIFEQTGHVGGMWNYSDDILYDEAGIPIQSGIYKNLTTNIPKETMSFPDFPFPNCKGRSYIHHSQVLKYLQDYAHHFDIQKHITFYTVVEHVKPEKLSDGRIEWTVTFSNVKTKMKEAKTYDAVMVCNGRHSVPNIPEIPGIDDFAGSVLHSHEYRENSSYKGQNVVILGAGPSGEDIGFEIAKVANEVILSHNSKLKTCPLPDNLRQEKGIARVNKSSVTFMDGKTYDCDAIVLCTGYKAHYPFLDPTCNLQIIDERITPLYFHTFLIDYPTLAIWSVTRYILPFIVFDRQAQVFLKFLKGTVSLPSPDEMRRAEEEDFKWRLDMGFKPNHAHDLLNERLWSFDDAFCKMGQVDQIPDCIRNLIRHVIKERDVDLMNYREHNYSLLDSNTYLQID